MSEPSTGPTRDPIEALENLGTGGIAVNPLEPAAVRRLGDQRRRRQHTMYGAIAAVAVAAAIIPTAILTTRDDGAAPPPITNSGTPDPTPNPTPNPTPTPSTITFPGSGVAVRSAADLAKLVGTTDDFKSFIGTALAKDSSCPTPEIDVMKYSSDGYAVGAVGGCGGYRALWAVENGAWKEALGTQDEWRCGDLARLSVPEGFAGQCYGPKEVFGPAEDAGLRLGMSADEVTAAGGTVSDQGNGCQYVYPAGLDRPKDGSTLGYLSASGKGVVALYAVKDQVTNRGSAIGDLEDAVVKVYPEGHLQQPQGAWYVPIDADSYYRFDFDAAGTVVRISIVANDQDCYE